MRPDWFKTEPKLKNPNPTDVFENQTFFTATDVWKLEILKSLGGFYDELAFSPTGLNRFHIRYNTD